MEAGTPLKGQYVIVHDGFNCNKVSSCGYEGKGLHPRNIAFFEI